MTIVVIHVLKSLCKNLTLAIRAAAETTATCPPGSWGDAWYASSAPSDNQDVIALR